MINGSSIKNETKLKKCTVPRIEIDGKEKRKR